MASTHPPQSETQADVQLARDADFLIQSFLPIAQHPSPPPYYASGLPLPFCTPQIATDFDSPFARGYSSALQSAANISQEQLLAFLDGLNLAMTSSPPLRVVKLVGTVIGFVPFHWAMIAGIAIETAAGTGMHVLSKTLTDRYLRAANLRLFKPRRLVVRLCTTAAMQHLVQRTGNGEGPSKLTKFGRGVGTVFLHAPLPFSSRIVRAIADEPPKVAASISDVGDGRNMPLATQRRLAALEGFALPLELDVPPPAQAQGIMDGMSAWAVASNERRAGKKENKVEQRRRQLARIEQQLQHMNTSLHGYTAQPAMSGGPSRGGHTGEHMPAMDRRERKEFRKEAKESRKGEKASRKEEKELRKEEKELRKEKGEGKEFRREEKDLRRGEKYLRKEEKELRKAARRARKRERKEERGGGLISGLIGPKESKLERRVANADLLEHWGSDKVLWVVIMNAELDNEIDGIEHAESLNDVEKVSAQTWQAEMVKERDILEEESDDELSSDEDSRGGHKHM
ncbi:hypothetical protein C8R43DRAFT_1229342 [Mycena crocata]|nr:hypothetical protein C8R43DRAFT_1229342 [Mycena crocata]